MKEKQNKFDMLSPVDTNTSTAEHCQHQFFLTKTTERSKSQAMSLRFQVPQTKNNFASPFTLQNSGQYSLEVSQRV